MSSEHENNDPGRGEHHTDDRTLLGYAYEGDELLAKVYKARAAREIKGCSWMRFVPTPEGEKHGL
jgi:hypothetical protein